MENTQLTPTQVFHIATSQQLLLTQLILQTLRLLKKQRPDQPAFSIFFKIRFTNPGPS